jgi:hypothetical protein
MLEFVCHPVVSQWAFDRSNREDQLLDINVEQDHEHVEHHRIDDSMQVNVRSIDGNVLVIIYFPLMSMLTMLSRVNRLPSEQVV